jgi:ADP-L-glycero-D-manno-heptose 6-epimerase
MEWLKQEEFWDIETTEPNILPDIKRYKWVIHLDEITDRCDENIDTIISKNLEYSQWLFNECNKYKVNFQYASSAEVYGKTKDFSEFAQCHPQTPYAWSKYLFDRWVFQQEHNISVQGFRHFNVYGRYMHTAEHIDIMCKWRAQAKADGKISIWENSAHIKRDWVWVGDVCRLHIDFIKTVHGSGIWNAGTGLSHSYLDIAEEIAYQEEAAVEFIPNTSTEPFNSKADLTKLKSTIGKRQWVNVYEWLDRKI